MQPDELYGLPLDRFIAERAALAKALRAAGDRPEAARVAKLRKPSVAAWAVNQLVRTQAQATHELFEAGDSLRRAQEDLLAGRGDARTLREAGERERRAVDELTTAARGLLSSDGHELAEATLARVASTLHAAAFDEDARRQVGDGCLERELRHVGLGDAGIPATRGAPAPAASEAPAPESHRAATPATDEAATPATDEAAPPAAPEAAASPTGRARAERRRAGGDLAAARRSEASARRRLQNAARALARAQEARDRAADALRRAEDALSAARAHADETADAHQRSQDALEGRSADRRP
ncbi:MAG: hypothetical protein JO168_08010 [Solirubrobacterales bacterium]|nr:hypothetical protein [Solirubrobacterales bacterium]MBV9715336.1 hypothetical protein [Solirubrobacterales bacterium]